MNYKKFILTAFLAISSLITLEVNAEDFDLTVVSSIDFNGSVRRHAIGLIECLKNDMKINFIPSREMDLTEVSEDVKKIVLGEDKTPGRVALLEDPLWYADAVPDSNIKIAYSVCESTKISSKWVEILNSKFDAVVVADPFYIEVYKNSGVNIPVFSLGLGCFLEEFLEKPLKKGKNSPFIFRCNARFFKRKNHELLVKAFHNVFKNSPKVKLMLNGGGKWSIKGVYNNLKKLIHTLHATNIHLSNDALSWKDYVSGMSKMDCYINISLAEGFSIAPREALALGIPTIITDNTAQKTIASSGFVRAVPSEILVKKFSTKANEDLGFQFNCKQSDVEKALKDVYLNYDKYLKKAHKGKEWARQYIWPNLRKKYINLVKPKKLIFGDRNEITEDFLMTDSKELYEKYLNLSN